MEITFNKSIFYNILTILKIAIPICLMLSIQAINDILMYSSLHSSDELAIVGMSSFLFNILVNVIIGFNFSVDTLSSQANGAGQQYQSLNQIYRTVIMNFSIITLTLPIILYSKQIQILMGQDLEKANESENQLLQMIPLLYLFSLMDCLNKFVINHGISNQSFQSSLGGLSSCFITVQLINYLTNQNMYQMILTNQIIMSTSLIVMTILIINSKKVISDLLKFTKIDFKIIKDVLLQLKLGIPAALMMICDSLSIELSVIFAGIAGDIEQKSQTVLMRIQLLLLLFFVGFEVSSSVCLGQSIGSGNREFGYKSILFNSGAQLIVIFLVMIVNVFLFDSFVKFIRNDQEILDMLHGIEAIFFISTTFDVIKFVPKGFIKALGLQFYAFIIDFIGNIIINIPFQYYLTIKMKKGLQGIQQSKIISDFLKFIAQIILIQYKYDEQFHLKDSKINNYNQDLIVINDQKTTEIKSHIDTNTHIN